MCFAFRHAPYDEPRVSRNTIFVPRIDLQRAEMFELRLDDRLFQLTERPPQCAPLSQLPPTLARTRPPYAKQIYHTSLIKIYGMSGPLKAALT